MEESPGAYDGNDYPQYAQSGPRTVPDHMGGGPLYPMTSSSYPVAVSQPAMPNLPMPPMRGIELNCDELPPMEGFGIMLGIGGIGRFGIAGCETATG